MGRGIKYPFVIRTIEERILLENKWMETFKKHRDEAPDWGDSNIHSCEHRLGELKEALEFLKTIVSDEKGN
jgi:hypothetical protein